MNNISEIITESLVQKLIKSQFPHWEALDVKLVKNGGHDNRTFRLGDTMVVRLPSAEIYVAQVEKESIWLHRLPNSSAKDNNPKRLLITFVSKLIF